jgi:hypothetical protein
MSGSDNSDWQSAIKNIARELDIGLPEAETWCERWERFAERRGVPRDDYFWDSGRGWIDAQRSFNKGDGAPRRLRVPRLRMPLAPPIPFARRVDPGFRGGEAGEPGPSIRSRSNGVHGARKRLAGTVADVGNR